MKGDGTESILLRDEFLSFYLVISVADSWQILHDPQHAVCCRHWYSLIPPDCNPSSWSHSLTQIQFFLRSSQQRKIHPKPAKQKKSIEWLKHKSKHIHRFKKEMRNTHLVRRKSCWIASLWRHRESQMEHSLMIQVDMLTYVNRLP